MKKYLLALALILCASMAYSQSLQVMISPQAAITAGAQWRVDGGTWHPNEYVQTGLAADNHLVEFSEISGYIKPVNQSISLSPGQTALIIGSYAPGGGSNLGDYSIGETLPLLGAIYVGRNETGSLILWFDMIPGNYVIVPKIGTMWVLSWWGVTFNFIPYSDSRIRMERRGK